MFEMSEINLVNHAQIEELKRKIEARRDDGSVDLEGVVGRPQRRSFCMQRGVKV